MLRMVLEMKCVASSVWHSILGFSIVVIASLLFWFSSVISKEFATMFMVFNLLFVPLTFPLDGLLAMKLLLLFAGNVIGFVWNSMLWIFSSVMASQFGEAFNTAYFVLSPFLNLVWIISFWSVSLTVLSKSKNLARR